MDDRERRRLDRKLQNAVGARAVLVKVEDGGKMQAMQLSGLDGEVWESVERPEEYGFTSNPTAGEAFVIFPDGDRSHPVVVAFGSRGSRKSGLAGGEVAVYHQNGDFIHFKNDNEIEVKTKKYVVNAEEIMLNAAAQAVVNASVIKLEGALQATAQGGGATTAAITGNLSATDTVTGKKDVVGGGVSLKGHNHRGDSGGTTGPPN